MTILGIDPGRRTGWALWDGERWRGGSWWLPRGARGKVLGEALRLFWRELEDLRRQYGRVAAAGFESVMHERIGRNIEGYGRAKIIGVLECWCARNRVGCFPYSVSALKEEATGDAMAAKGRVFGAAKREWAGVEIDCHDMADAMWLAKLAAKELGRAI